MPALTRRQAQKQNEYPLSPSQAQAQEEIAAKPAKATTKKTAAKETTAQKTTAKKTTAKGKAAASEAASEATTGVASQDDDEATYQREPVSMQSSNPYGSPPRYGVRTQLMPGDTDIGSALNPPEENGNYQDQESLPAIEEENKSQHLVPPSASVRRSPAINTISEPRTTLHAQPNIDIRTSPAFNTRSEPRASSPARTSASIRKSPGLNTRAEPQTSPPAAINPPLRRTRHQDTSVPMSRYGDRISSPSRLDAKHQAYARIFGAVEAIEPLEDIPPVSQRKQRTIQASSMVHTQACPTTVAGHLAEDNMAQSRSAVHPMVEQARHSPTNQQAHNDANGNATGSTAGGRSKLREALHLMNLMVFGFIISFIALFLWDSLYQSAGRESISPVDDSKTVFPEWVQKVVKPHGEGPLPSILPSRLVVELRDGRFEMPEQFWTALVQRLTSNNDNGTLWQNFLHDNYNQLHNLSQHHHTTQSDIKRIISSEMMHELITEKLRTAYDDTIGDVHRKLASELRDRDRNSIQLQNKYDELHELNHFSPVLGARIDPRLTSKTLNTRSVFNPLTWANSNDNGPITALQLWQEAGDCWCARPKPNSNIKAQLGVRMGQNINPHDFVVEHLPKYGAADISSAPKDLEFWIKTPSEEHARAVHEIVSFRMTRHKTDLCKTSPPSPDYVCIGTGTYLINGRNWVQRYRSFLQLEDLPMGSSKLVFRVTSTWGSKHTCLYRVRVTGEDVAVGLREGQRRHYYMGKHDR